MADLVHIRGRLRRGDGAKALALVAELFPTPGAYLLEKASGSGSFEQEGAFDEWFLARLEQIVHDHHVSARDAMWRVLDEWLIRAGAARPSDLDFFELQQTIADLGTASTARMVGFEVPPALLERLARLGWEGADALDFPALAYRMGKVYDHLFAAEQMTRLELLDAARSMPLSPAEEEAVRYARARAGANLRPIFDANGRVWTAEREREPLRALLGERMPTRQTIAKVAADLGQQQRAMGVIRDAERVARTEIADAELRGAWGARAGAWAPGERLYRMTSRGACNTCLRLYKQPDGLPRIYTREEVEREDAKGLNRGPQDSWHITIGPTHPNCACQPWAVWDDALANILAGTAADFARVMARRQVFRAA